MTRPGRWSAALLATVALMAVAAPVQAHGGDSLGLPVIERITPEAEGVSVKVVYTANFQFVAANTTDQDLLILAESGEPFLRIGPEGVFGNFRSPTWFGVNAPEGIQTFPPGVDAGADVEPDWKLIRHQPSFGWFDHRLHPKERYVKADVKKSKVPVDLGSWKVPIRYGDQAGAIAGRFEYQPVLGQYRSRLRSSKTPVEGVSVQLAASSSKGGVPAMFVENRSPEPVVVLGDSDEPFVRLDGKAEVNLRSPVWAAIEQARGRILTTPADASAEPEWHEVQDTPRWGWAELRAAPPRANPARSVLESDGPAPVKEWTIPLLIGDKRTEIEGVTEFVPEASAVKAYQAAAGETGDDEGNGGMAALMALGVLAILGGVFVARKKKTARADTADPADPADPERPVKLGRIKRR